MWNLDIAPLYSLLILCAIFLQTNSQGFGVPFSSMGFSGIGTPNNPFTFGNSDFGINPPTINFATPQQTLSGFGASGGFGIPSGFGSFNLNSALPALPNTPFVNGQPQSQFSTVSGMTPTISGGTLQGVTSQVSGGTPPVVTPPISRGTLSAAENSVTSRFTNIGSNVSPSTGVNANTPGLTPGVARNNQRQITVSTQQIGAQNPPNSGAALIPGQGNTQLSIGLPSQQGFSPVFRGVPTISISNNQPRLISPNTNTPSLTPGVAWNIQRQNTVLTQQNGPRNPPNSGAALFPVQGNTQLATGLPSQQGFLPLRPNNQPGLISPNTNRVTQSQQGIFPASPGSQRTPQNSQNSNLLLQRPKTGCQLSGCNPGEQCIYIRNNERFICPDWIPSLACQCMRGCRVMNYYIPMNTAMRVDTCGNTCSCMRDDGTAACTVLSCDGAKQTPPGGEIAPPSITIPQPTETNPSTSPADSTANQIQ